MSTNVILLPFVLLGLHLEENYKLRLLQEQVQCNLTRVCNLNKWKYFAHVNWRMSDCAQTRKIGVQIFFEVDSSWLFYSRLSLSFILCIIFSRIFLEFLGGSNCYFVELFSCTIRTQCVCAEWVVKIPNKCSLIKLLFIKNKKLYETLAMCDFQV